MKMKENSPFQDNLDIIQPLLENLSITNESWIKFVNSSGAYICTPINKQQCNFCRLIRNHPVGYQRCRETAQKCVHLDPKKHHLFHCHAGLYVLAVPLQGEQGSVGALATGEIKINTGAQDVGQVLQKVADLNLSEERLLAYYEELPVIKREKVLLLGETLYAASNCFLRLGATEAKVQQVEAEKALLNSELRALSYQINPHFLFNTLNTIQMLSIIEGAKKTPDIINALSSLLRARLNVNDPLISVKDEITVIENLLIIHKTRYEDRFEFVLDIPCEILDAQIPAFSLQPLVENALIHGLEPYEGVGCLELKAEVRGEDLIFHVRDNGVGITPHEQARIIKNLDRKGVSEFSEIGLANVHQRCHALYGKDYGICIESEKNRGTDVTLCCPL